MAKAPEPKPQTAPAPEPQSAPQDAPATVFEMSVEDFCAEKSRAKNSPELIGAFYASEVRAGTVKALASELEARFDAFCNRPA